MPGSNQPVMWQQIEELQTDTHQTNSELLADVFFSFTDSLLDRAATTQNSAASLRHSENKPASLSLELEFSLYLLLVLPAS